MPGAGIHNSAAQPIAAAVPRWNRLILCISWAPLSLFQIFPRRRNAYRRRCSHTLPRIGPAIHRLGAVGGCRFNPAYPHPTLPRIIESVGWGLADAASLTPLLHI